MSQGALVVVVQATKRTEDEACFDREQDGLDNAAPEQAGELYVAHQNIAEARGAGSLAGDWLQDQVGSFTMIAIAADNDSGTLLAATLVVKGNGTSTTSPKL